CRFPAHLWLLELRVGCCLLLVHAQVSDQESVVVHSFGQHPFPNGLGLLPGEIHCCRREGTFGSCRGRGPQGNARGAGCECSECGLSAEGAAKRGCDPRCDTLGLRRHMGRRTHLEKHGTRTTLQAKDDPATAGGKKMSQESLPWTRPTRNSAAPG